MNKVLQEAEVKSATIIAYKGFELGYVCRGHSFSVDESYSVEGQIEACSNGFHACEHPLSVFEHYPPGTSVYGMVELSGDMDVEADKTAARTIKLVRKLSLTEMIEAAVEYTKSRAVLVEGGLATGDNEAATASGDQGAATASGDQGAATASGYRGAATASGYRGAATASGDRGAATASGYRGAATASGYRGAATASGDQGAATASGDQGAATASGKFASAHASGLEGSVSGAEGTALHLDERLDHWGHDDHGKIIHVWAGIVGQDGIKPETFYTLRDGKPVEVA